MLVCRSYKTELDPNNVQRTLLAKHVGVARFVWNWALNRRIKEYKLIGKSSNAIEQHRQLNALKEINFPWMYEVSKCAPQESLRDLDKAFKNFYDKRTRFPRFKGKKYGLGAARFSKDITVKNDRIKLPRLGWIRLKESGYVPVDAKINSVTIKEKTGRWFVSVQVEEQIVAIKNRGLEVGIDLGLKSFAVCSDGSVIESPKFLFRSLRKLRRLSRQHSRKKKGSNNRKKTTKRLTLLHSRIGYQRSDFLHKATTKLTKTKSVIVVEDLNVSGMMKNHRLARSISDAGWSKFIRQLEYKSVWYGSKLIKVGRFFPSTKTCSACGEVKDKMPLSVRTYRCDGCGLVIDRDLNAARNLLNLSSASSARFQACRDLPAGGSMKQEPNVVSENGTGTLEHA